MGYETPQELRLGDRVVKVEPLSGRKAARAFKILRGVSKEGQAILDAWTDFSRQYAEKNVVELSRAEAISEYGAEEFADVTDADWEASGNKFRVGRRAPLHEKVAHVFPEAFDLAEEEVFRLLALVAATNAEVKEHRGDLEDFLSGVVEDIMDAPFEDLIELAVVGGEMVNEQYVRKAQQLGGRLGNALRLVGINLDQEKGRPQPPETPNGEGSEDEQEQTSSTGKPGSSTDSPPPTGGDPTSPSTPTGGSSSALTTASP